MIAKPISLALPLLGALAGLTGCNFSLRAPHMRPAASEAIVPDPAEATVVFVRHSSDIAGVTPIIATAQGRFLGEAEANSYFVATLPPGEHLFVSWSEGAPALRASLAPGLVYYVQVEPKMGLAAARMHLFSLGPRRASWANLPGWLAQAHRIEANEAAGAQALTAYGREFANQVRAAEQSYRTYSPEDRAARTLAPEDGVREAIAPRAAALALPPPSPSAWNTGFDIAKLPVTLGVPCPN